MAYESPSESGQELKRAQAGSASALTRLMERCRPLLLRHAHLRAKGRLSPRFGASDLVQETELRGVRRFRTFRGQTIRDLQGWLIRILHNRANRLLRRYGREIAGLGNGSDYHIDAADPTPTPEHSVIAGEITQQTLELFHTAHNHLNALDRRVFDARHPPDGSEAIPYAVLALELGHTAPALRKRYERVLDKLRDDISLLHIVSRPGFPSHYSRILRGKQLLGWTEADVACELEVSLEGAELLIERAETALRAARRGA